MTAPQSFSPSANHAASSARYAWYVVYLLAGLQVVANMQRQVLSLMVEPLKIDLRLTDLEVSYLQGTAFALLFALSAIPIGWLTDRWKRNRILILGMGIWTIATIGSMAAQSYAALFLSILLAGLGNAALAPPSFSLISDYCPREKQATAVGLISGATFLGTGTCLTFGGVMMDTLPISQSIALPLFGSIHGWQLIYGILAIPGVILLGMLVLTLREPQRRNDPGQGASQTSTVREMLAYVYQHNGYLVSLLFGMVMLAAFQYSYTNWAVTMFIRTYQWTPTEIGLLYGLIFMIIGPVASVAGGRLCDGMRSRGRKDANFIIALYSSIAMIFLALVFALGGSALLSAIMLCLITFLAVMSFGPSMAAVPAYAPSSMRGQLTALMMMLNTLLGAGSGPWLTALLTDEVFRDPAKLNLSLAVCAPLLLIPAALLFHRGAKAARG